jgi:hypothetical protein
MSATSKAGLSSMLALVLCSLAGIGAPPSEFVREPTIWAALEPMMWPALFGGTALALLALILALFTPRGAALTCIAASVTSMFGVAIAWGLDANGTPRGLLLPIAFLAVPALGAIEAIHQSHREAATHGESSMEESAG